MNLLTLAVVLLGAALLSVAAVWLSIRVSNRLQIVDHPDVPRKSQTRPIPLLGGLAVAITFTICAITFLAVGGSQEGVRQASGILIPALAAASIGFIDDRRHIRPSLRLALQALLGFIAWLLGTRIELLGVGLVDAILTVLWFMVIINGINLLDNSDGLAGLTVAVSALGATIIAVLYGQELVSLLGVALVGVCIGYLWHNWYPARVYMGDSGAYFLGFLLAALVIRLSPEAASPLAGAVIALLLVSLPLLDTLFVVVLRIREGRHPFTAGRDHLAHTLQRRGYSVPHSVVVLQMTLVTTVTAAVVIALLQTR